MVFQVKFAYPIVRFFSSIQDTVIILNIEYLANIWLILVVRVLLIIT